MLWGAERIRDELLKLGIRVSKRTIQKYMRWARSPGKRGQIWNTSLKNHTGEISACDFLQLYDALFRPILVFSVVNHGTREVVHFHVTRCPTDAWVTQQLRETTPWGDGPKYLIRDNDDKSGGAFNAVAEGTGIEVVKIPSSSPNLNPVCERLLGSARRECLDHVLLLSERQLRRVLREYVETYLNRARPHQGLSQRIPAAAASRPSADDRVDDLAVVQGLSQIAAAAFSPVIMGTDPGFLGLDRFTELGQPLDLSATFRQAEYTRWRAFRETEDSRFVGLTLPKVLMRQPYQDDGSRSEGFRNALATMGNRVDFWFYLRRHLPPLEQNVSAETFALGCTPVVNLFHKRAEPIQLDQTRPEYRVVPDARRPKAAEVYSVDRVTASAPEGGDVTYWPFYGIKHGSVSEESRTFWSTSRRGASDENPGTEVFLSLVDLDFEPSAAADWVVNVDTACLNRDLPGRLPFGGGQPRLQLSEGAGPIERIECLTAPSATLRPPLKQRAMWRLISHLSLNHLSVSEGEKGAEALREILSLYNFSDSAETRAMIDGVLRVNSRPTTARVLADGRSALARGVEITVEFDNQRFAGSNVYLFASVLERFLALYCTLNSFTRMVATIKGRDGVLCRWPARAGEKPLL